jgi:SOS-response transcriptional repressor LexA
MKITDIRLEHLKKLVKDMGSQVAFANKIKRSPQQVSGWLLQNKGIGETIARHIEISCNLESGYLDKPFGQESITNNVLPIPILKSSTTGIKTDLNNLFPVNKEILKSFAWKQNNLCILVVEGDSMAPTIQNNSIVLIDKSQMEIEDGKIYALSKNNEIFIRRVFKQVGSTSYEAKSDNDKFGKINFKPSSPIKIIGRIVYLLGQEL